MTGSWDFTGGAGFCQSKILSRSWDFIEGKSGMLLSEGAGFCHKEWEFIERRSRDFVKRSRILSGVWDFIETGRILLRGSGFCREEERDFVRESHFGERRSRILSEQDFIKRNGILSGGRDFVRAGFCWGLGILLRGAGFCRGGQDFIERSWDFVKRKNKILSRDRDFVGRAGF